MGIRLKHPFSPLSSSLDHYQLHEIIQVGGGNLERSGVVASALSQECEILASLQALCGLRQVI